MIMLSEKSKQQNDKDESSDESFSAEIRSSDEIPVWEGAKGFCIYTSK
jgi:hypothetical protein